MGVLDFASILILAVIANKYAKTPFSKRSYRQVARLANRLGESQER